MKVRINLKGLGDPSIWHQLYSKYGWVSNNSDTNGWGTVYKYEGKEVSPSLLDKVAADTQHIWGSVSVWDNSSYDVAERTLIAQSNLVRRAWGWANEVSKVYPRPPITAPYVPPAAVPAPTVQLPIKPAVVINQLPQQPVTVSSALPGTTIGTVFEKEAPTPVEGSSLTKYLLIASILGGIVIASKYSKQQGE